MEICVIMRWKLVNWKINANFGKLRFFIWQKVEHTPSVLVTPLYLHKYTIYIKLNSFGNTVAYILFKIVF